MPSASSCFLHIFGFRKIAQEKVPEKIRKIAKNYFATKEAKSQKASTRGPPEGGGDPLARVGPHPRPRAAQGPLAPLAPTFCPIYSFASKPPEARPFFQNSIPRRRHHQNPKTGVQQTCPGTLLEGEIIIGGLFITMPASGEMRE